MRCVVPNCNNDSSSACFGISFHKFPTEPSRLAAWVAALRKEGWQPANGGAVCSAHFLADDLAATGGRRKLRRTAVPVFDIQKSQVSNKYTNKNQSLRSSNQKATRSQTGARNKIVKYTEHSNESDEEVNTKKLARLHKYDDVHTGVTKEMSDMSDHSSSADRTIPSIPSAHQGIDVVQVKIEKDDDWMAYDNEDSGNMDSLDGHGSNDVKKVKVETDESFYQCSSNVVYLPSHRDIDVDVKVERDVIDQTSDSDEEDMGAVCRPTSSEQTPTSNIRVEKEDSSDWSCDDEDKGKSDTSDIRPTREKEEEPETNNGILSKVKEMKEKLKSLSQLQIGRGAPLLPGDDNNKGSINDKFSCTICPYQSNSEVTLWSHLKAHAAPKSYSCETCHYRTVNEQHLKSHVIKHSGEKPYACVICGKSFTQKSSLGKHLRIHTGEKPHACHICNKAFAQRARLNNHLRIHTGDKPFICNICKKAFGEKGNLQIHLKIHSEKLYSCHICGKSFTQKSTLEKHLRTHSGERPYACDVCKKAFTQKGKLTSHLRIHTGEMPYLCNICNKEFRENCYLQKHMKVHSEKDTPDTDTPVRNSSIGYYCSVSFDDTL